MINHYAIQHDYLDTSKRTMDHLIEPNSVDLIVADPPYNIGKDYADDPTGDKLSPEQFRHMLSRAIMQNYHILRPGGVMFWLCPADQMFSIYGLLTTWAPGRLLWDTPIIWHEPFAQNQRKRLTCNYRVWFPIVKGVAEPTFNGQDILIPTDRATKYNDPRSVTGLKVPGRVWKYRRLQGRSKDWQDWHPCQLAPEQLERIVLGWSNLGDTVVDAFAGSGSLGAVCVKNGRNFIGIDRSPTYVQKINERLERCRTNLSS